MFADPITITSQAGDLTIPRVDAGPKSGSYEKNAPGVSKDTFNIRNSEYVSKPFKRTMRRHNIELQRTVVVAATATSPATTKVIKVYAVIEHDDIVSLQEIEAAASQLGGCLVPAINAGFVAKLVNNEG